MKRLVFLILICTVVIATAASAQVNMLNTKHDMSLGSTSGGSVDTTAVQVCVFCHTPHNTSVTDLDGPLWNHQISTTANYGTYTSNTMNATGINDIGGATTSALTVDNLCMSCHDGTVGIGNLYNQPNEGTSSLSGTKITGASNMGTDLSNDHPINFSYESARTNGDNELTASSGGAVGNAPLFGGLMACASCHDPHSTTYSYFLVDSHVDSLICANCHTK